MQYEMPAARRSSQMRRARARVQEGVPDPAASPVEAVLLSHYRMTPREAQVAVLLAFRCSNKEVALRLGIAIHTARHHTGQVLAKLGLSSRCQVRDTLSQPLRLMFWQTGLFQ